jgi:hypothetical protein
MTHLDINYFNQVQALYNCEEFKSGAHLRKRELIGNMIYDHIERIVGQETAPKLCGMVIDLPPEELY